MDQEVQKVEIVKEVIVRKAPSSVPLYATLCGIFALVAAILSFLIPIAGPLFITLIAVFLGGIAILGGSKGLGVATAVIVTVNLVISPSFWISLTGSNQNGGNANFTIAFIDIIAVILLYVSMAFRPKND
jgi:hypothetical protein